MKTDAPAASLQHLHEWVGRSERRADTVTAAPLAALAATLDRADPAPQPGSAVPPLAHWLYFTPLARQSELGPDGHARRGGFLPPVPLPRRMWAGGRLRFHHALQVGDAITRTSTIQSVEAKHGRSGALVFVTVRHEIANARGTAITEEHDIVYREAPTPGAAPANLVTPATPAPAQPGGAAAPTGEQFGRDIQPDAVLLFRYSALTFNGHRIHYDRAYVTAVEGYPGLVVHGPLIATLLADLLRRERPDAALRSFAFKAAQPLFDIHPFRLCGRVEADQHYTLWARGPDGAPAMRAQAELA